MVKKTTNANRLNAKSSLKENNKTTVRLPTSLLDSVERARYLIASSGFLKHRDAFIAILIKNCLGCESCMRHVRADVEAGGRENADYIP